MLDEIDPAAIADPATRTLNIRLLNLVDQQAGQLRAPAGAIQRLRDEIARLKGEQREAQGPDRTTSAMW